MPLYDYENLTTGERKEIFRPIAHRDIPGHRRLMPERILVHMHGLKEPDPVNLVAEAKKGFYRSEERHGAGHIERTMGRSMKDIKRIWNNFHETDQRPARAA